MSDKARDLRNLSLGEIEKSLEEKYQALRAFRSSLMAREAKNYREGRRLRKELARRLTLLKEKAVAGK